MSEGMANARILPIRPGVGFAVVSLIAGILAFLTARDCNRNLEFHHLQAPFAPSLLYGCVVWVWWVVVTLVLWTLADRWAAAFKPSALTVMAHLGASCVLATRHLALLQHTVWFASWHWPAFGRRMATFGVENLERFGVELVIYGFISGVCAFLHSRMQTQQALIQKLEVERQLTQAQLKALQMQMEPHFLFNTLNALASLVALGRNREASKTLEHLDTILRTTLRRRTRRNLRRYLSTWVDWKSSKLGEGIKDFRSRALKDEENEETPLPDSVLPWALHEKSDAGSIRDTKRNSGTVQKDWAVVKSSTLPDHFCIAVVGHQGWSYDPDSAARYALAVTFEILGQEIAIYEPLRAAIVELQTEIEADVEIEVEIGK